MPSIDINDVGSIGLIKDQPSHQLVPEAWNFLYNVRIIEDSIGRLGGYSQTFGELPTGNDSFTKVLLHFDGVDASTQIVDSNAGGSAHTWTAIGTAALDTAVKVFGSASLELTGSGGITTPHSADLDVTSQDFAIDFRLNFSSIPAATMQRLVQKGLIASNNFAYAFDFDSTTNMLEFFVGNGTGITHTVFASWAPSTSTDYHVQVGKTGTVIQTFIGGVQIGTTSGITSTVFSGAGVMSIGFAPNGSNPAFAHVDEFRLSVGTNRSSTNFSSPTSEYFTASQSTPQFLMGVTTPSTQYWLWTSLTKAFVTDGQGTHSNLTRTSSGVDQDYAAATGHAWNGTFIGGIPILNNGTDVPQYWSSTSPATRLSNLANWPSFLRARVVRSFGPYLMALNTTASGVVQPHNVRWSHPADPGSIPSSWDITDPTVDAGSVDLPDVESGIILDGLPLQGRFYVYKENSVWRFRGVGGRSIFEQDAFLETIGLLCSRALAVTGDGKRHIFASQDDVMLHDGNAVRSILDGKLKRTLFNSIDVSTYQTSFMMIYPLRNEAWFCYPETGNSFPNRAIIYNYARNRITEGDCDWRHWAQGVVQTSDSELWSSSDESWDTDLGLWSNANRRKVVLVRTAVSEFALLDDGTTRDGVEFTGTLQRTGLAIVGKKRNGEWIEDFQQRKLVTRLWPKISGGEVSIRVGSQAVPDGAVTWSPAQSFDPETELFVDFIVEGVAIALEISGTTPFKIDGYKIEMELTGNF